MKKTTFVILFLSIIVLVSWRIFPNCYHNYKRTTVCQGFTNVQCEINLTPCDPYNITGTIKAMSRDDKIYFKGHLGFQVQSEDKKKILYEGSEPFTLQPQEEKTIEVNYEVPHLPKDTPYVGMNGYDAGLAHWTSWIIVEETACIKNCPVCPAGLPNAHMDNFVDGEQKKICEDDWPYFKKGYIVTSTDGPCQTQLGHTKTYLYIDKINPTLPIYSKIDVCEITGDYLPDGWKYTTDTKPDLCYGKKIKVICKTK